MKAAIVIMSKVPIPGRTKTRLAQSIGPEKSALFHRACLQDLNLLIKESGYPGYLYFTGGAGKYISQLCPGMTLRQQKGRDLGEKLFNAACEVLVGHDKVIFLGADLPYLKPDILDEAMRTLDDVDVVIGPASDGGYYMIGMKKPYKCLFEDIPWSSDEVTDKTLRTISQHGLTSHLITKLFDIDTWQDLMDFYHLCLDSKESYIKLLNSYKIAEKIYLEAL